MAYCKILSIKRGIRNADSAIQKTTDYVKDEEKTLLTKTYDYVRNKEKTEKELFVYDGNCNAGKVVDDFMAAKARFGDEGREISHYHIIQSFSPEENVTPEQVHRMGKELAAQGFKVNLDSARKYWNIQGKDWKRPFRIYRLGAEYTNEMLTKRILHSLDGRSDEKTAKDYFIRRKKVCSPL